MEGTFLHSLRKPLGPTGITVRCCGAILVPSGRKLTVGQQRRRRQRGGAAGEHWRYWYKKTVSAAYVRKAGGDRPDLQTNVVGQFALSPA